MTTNTTIENFDGIRTTLNECNKIFKTQTINSEEYENANLEEKRYKYNDFYFIFYDFDNVVYFYSNLYNKPIHVYNPDSPDDELMNWDWTLYWKYDSNKATDSEYKLYKLNKYGKYTHDDVYYCKKYGLLQCVNKINKTFKILKINRDLNRNAHFVNIESPSFARTGFREEKLYIETFKKNYLKKLQPVATL